MNSILRVSLLALMSLFLVSCGYHQGNFSNSNQNITNVSLQENNFKVIQRVTGEASAEYVLGIGGFSEKALIESAKADMMKNADLVGTSTALVNVVVEKHLFMVFPFYYRKTITVSGHIVEFID